MVMRIGIRGLPRPWTCPRRRRLGLGMMCWGAGRRCPSCPLTTPNAGPLSQAFASNLRLRPTLVFCTSDVMTMKLDVIFPRARPEMPTISAAPLSGKGRPHHAIPAPPSCVEMFSKRRELLVYRGIRIPRHKGQKRDAAHQESGVHQ